MLDWLKKTEMATRLESAIARVIAEGKVSTYNIFVAAATQTLRGERGKASTLDVAKAIGDYAS